MLNIEKGDRIFWPLLLAAGMFFGSLGKRVVQSVPPWLPAILPWASSRAWESKAPPWAVPLVQRAARAAGIPAALLAALVRTESAWQPQVVSPAGAIGLAQLMPATAAELGVDPWDPAANVLGGARYLRAQLDRFGRVELALAAYNAGPHRVAQYGGVPPFAETRAYVERIMTRLREP